MKKKYQNYDYAFMPRFIYSVLLFMVIFVPFHSCQEPTELSEQDKKMLKSASIVADDFTTFWGIKRFTRSNGSPEVVRLQIGSTDLNHFEQGYIIRFNNGDGTSNLVSSAIIKIDGNQVFSNSNFSQRVTSFSKVIPHLNESSIIEIELNGAPGSYIDLWIEGRLKAGFALITKKGGRVLSENGLVEITIPEDAIENSKIIGINEKEIYIPQIIEGEAIGKPYNLEPNGLRFLKPIEIKINYSGANINENDAENIGILHYSDSFADVVPVINNTECHEITFRIGHFSQIVPFVFQHTWAVYSSYWVIPKIKWYLEIPSKTSFLTSTNIQKALNLWQNATNCFMFERVFSENDANIKFKEAYTLPFLEAASCGLFTFQVNEINILGVTCQNLYILKRGEDDKAEIRIASNDLTNDDLAVTLIAHEVGHVLGLAHPATNNVCCIMNAEISQPNLTLHPWDLAALYYHYAPNNISNTTWDVTVFFNSTDSWHADVTFNADGTTKYDEPDHPGVYLRYGKWSLDNNKIHWDIGFPDFYIFDGTVTGNSMNGKFLYSGTLRNWSAIKR